MNPATAGATANRRGMALLAALWFVVAIATVGLALSLEARQHRAVGLAAADRHAAKAAAAAGLAIAQARLERATRQLPRTGGSAVDRLRASDPWLEPDALFPATLYLGDFAVRLHGEDLQAKLNVNAVNVPALRTFLGLLLQDYQEADALAQAIADWRDRDDLRRPRGAERDDYLADQRLDLPGNRGGFRDLEELRGVQGMTPEIFARIRPYLRLHGNSVINVNTAPAAVLRAIPGMTDAVITHILAIRSQRQRITSLAEIGGSDRLQAAFTTTQLALTVTVVPVPPAPIVQEVWTINRYGDQAHVVQNDDAF